MCLGKCYHFFRHRKTVKNNDCKDSEEMGDINKVYSSESPSSEICTEVNEILPFEEDIKLQ